MLLFILFGWALFRAPDLPWLFDIFFHPVFGAALGHEGLALLYSQLVVFFAFFWIIIWQLRERMRNSWLLAATHALTALSILLLSLEMPIDFYYFRF